ncbi:hypothetical protein SLS59_005254 [Nothophoma quercina]|uniref:Uncharacterized protein n=1 Tax=Nothophoma quercina TaxID=749835 RepID=A0ABR3RCF3_9PLEO
MTSGDEEEEPESDYSNRGRSKAPKQSKSRRRVREPEYSVSEYESESSEPAIKPRQQKLIKNKPEYIVPGFDEDYAPASDFKLARSDEDEHASEMMEKPWGGPSKEKKRKEKHIARRTLNDGEAGIPCPKISGEVYKALAMRTKYRKQGEQGLYISLIF